MAVREGFEPPELLTLYRVATCCLTTRPPHLIYMAGKVRLEPDDPALNPALNGTNRATSQYIGRDGWIRTSDFVLPMHASCQAGPHPDTFTLMLHKKIYYHNRVHSS